MKKRKKAEVNPKEYLNKVLKEWIIFCDTHKNIAHSIADILKRNEYLEQENYRLSVEIERLKGVK